MVNNAVAVDLAGKVYFQQNYFQSITRIKQLRDNYLSVGQLQDRLEDLPIQLENPQTRPWKPIDWHGIHQEQIIGIELNVFLAIIAGAIDTEAPIHGYTQTSRQYLEKVHPPLARFIGGTVGENGEIIQLGLWEKEERQHSPALNKIYRQLSGKSHVINPRTIKTYRPSDNAYEDLYRHGLHRVMTEYGAVCLYLWLMARTTGILQQVLGELLQDEINHLAKFWSFGLWAYPDSYFSRMGRTLMEGITLQVSSTDSHVQFTTQFRRTLKRMMGVLHWESWSWSHRWELIWVFILVMGRFWSWSASLTSEYLRELLSDPPTP